MKKLFALIMTTLLVTTMAVSAFASEAGACKGIVPKVEAGSVVIDGTKDAAYDNALCVDINQFLSGADQPVPLRRRSRYIRQGLYALDRRLVLSFR